MDPHGGSHPTTESLAFSVTPAAPGEQLVRTSLPFPPGLFGTNAWPQVIAVSSSATGTVSTASLRILSLHPPNPQSAISIRRGLLSFVHDFKDREPVRFEVRPAAVATISPTAGNAALPADLPVLCSPRPDGLELRWNDGTGIDLALIAPALALPGRHGTRRAPAGGGREHCLVSLASSARA